MTTRRILIVSDAWRPQVNGVVRTIAATVHELKRMGHEVDVVGPERFRTFPCPTYPEIRLAWRPRSGLAAAIEAFRPDAIHIATEGPLGMAARSLFLERKTGFTPPITRSSPNTSMPACACRWHGPTRSCAASMRLRRR